MGIEEPKRSSQRVATDEQHGDIKLSAACRSVGDGSNRAGKRKISWQDRKRGVSVGMERGVSIGRETSERCYGERILIFFLFEGI